MNIIGKKKKTYASITAPLGKMLDELKSYIQSQKTQILRFNTQKNEIDKKIAVSENEINSSKHSVEQLSKIIKPTDAKKA